MHCKMREPSSCPYKIKSRTRSWFATASTISTSKWTSTRPFMFGKKNAYQKTWKLLKRNFTKAVTKNHKGKGRSKRDWDRKSGQGEIWNKPWQYRNHLKISDQDSIDNWRTNGMPCPTWKSKIPNSPSLWRPNSISNHTTNQIIRNEPNHINTPSGNESTSQKNWRRKQWQWWR